MADAEDAMRRMLCQLASFKIKDWQDAAWAAVDEILKLRAENAKLRAQLAGKAIHDGKTSVAEAGRRGGQARAKNMTEEDRRAAGRKGAEARWRKKE